MNEKMTKELHLKLVEAHWDGRLQFSMDSERWISSEAGPSAVSNPSHWRIRPEPKLRPWKPEEVPLPMAFRWKSNPEEPCVALGIVDSSIQYACRNHSIGFAELEDLRTNAEHSVDFCKTWFPCGVEEVEK